VFYPRGRTSNWGRVGKFRPKGPGLRRGKATATLVPREYSSRGTVLTRLCGCTRGGQRSLPFWCRAIGGCAAATTRPHHRTTRCGRVWGLPRRCPGAVPGAVASSCSGRPRAHRWRRRLRHLRAAAHGEVCGLRTVCAGGATLDDRGCSSSIGEGRYLLGCTTGTFILPSVQVQAAKPQVRGWRAHAAGRSETCWRCPRRSPGRRGIVMWALGSATRRVDRFPRCSRDTSGLRRQRRRGGRGRCARDGAARAARLRACLGRAASQWLPSGSAPTRLRPRRCESRVVGWCHFAAAVADEEADHLGAHREVLPPRRGAGRRARAGEAVPENRIYRSALITLN
jgi:hypothetical protein